MQQVCLPQAEEDLVHSAILHSQLQVKCLSHHDSIHILVIAFGVRKCGIIIARKCGIIADHYIEGQGQFLISCYDVSVEDAIELQPT